MLKLNKYFYFLKLKSNLLNKKYIILLKNNIQNQNSQEFMNIKLIKNKVNSIFKNWVDFVFNSYNILIFNNLELLLKIKKHKLYIFCYNGFFINNNYLKQINNYIIFYTYNYKYFLLIIYRIINNFIIIIFNIIFKLIISMLINRI